MNASSNNCRYHDNCTLYRIYIHNYYCIVISMFSIFLILIVLSSKYLLYSHPLLSIIIMPIIVLSFYITVYMITANAREVMHVDNDRLLLTYAFVYSSANIPLSHIKHIEVRGYYEATNSGALVIYLKNHSHIPGAKVRHLPQYIFNRKSNTIEFGAIKQPGEVLRYLAPYLENARQSCE